MTAIAPIVVPDGSARFAYALYATNDTYAVAAMVAVRALQRLGIDAGIDLVVLHLGVSPYLVKTMRRLGILPVRVAPLHPLADRYYRDCLVRLRVFQLVQYERVVCFDVDALPLKPLHDLFALAFDAPIAAANAYWLPGTRFTSALIAARPSLSSFDRCARSLGDAAANGLYDMDILNLAFAGDSHRLPRDAFALNSEWEDGDGRHCLGDPDERFAACRLVHFTALGKPWTHRPEVVRLWRPGAHRRFHDLWQRWWELRDEVAQAVPPGFRARYVRLRDYPPLRGCGSDDP